MTNLWTFRVATTEQYPNFAAALSPFIHLLQAVIDPLRGEFFLHRILPQARRQAGKIDRVEGLILIEAGEDHGFQAAHRVAVRLQALGADFLWALALAKR